jgi:hypothetical protein
MKKIRLNKVISSALVSLSFVLVFPSLVIGQSSNDQLERIGLNTITTAVPFLLISPDSRAGAMGDVGVATSADANSNHWNASKLAFVEQPIGLSFSYIPWLSNLAPDINMVYMSGYKSINDRATAGASIRYFSLGEIQFTDDSGNNLQKVNPNEVAVDGAFAYKFSERFAGSFALRYIFSNLTAGVSVGGSESRPAQAVAVDLGGLYSREMTLSDKDAKLNLGFNISNIGNKVSYSETAERDFIPINMRLGAGLETFLDDYNSLGIYFDINKLLVPTPPVYEEDEQGNIVTVNGEPQILAGQNPDVSVPVGMLQSFYDAPGGFSEELKEYNISTGLEYWYDQQFAMRGGFFYEHPDKGNRQFITLGFGLKYQMLFLDFSYLVPISQRNPLENTIRFTLGLDFSELKKKEE